MQMKNFVHDFPGAVEFEQSEQVCVTVAGPILELKSCCGDCASDINMDDPRL